MRHPGIAIGFVTCMLLATGATRAAVPGQVDFQGLLLDSAGQPATGTVDLVFDLYDAPSGGALLWSETLTDVPLSDGVYSVTLGQTTPLTPAVLSTGDVHLEITVDGEVLSPRRALLAVPYAVRAAEADAVAGQSGVFYSQLVQHVSFDGGLPDNEDPREGTGDTDGDGIPNWLDRDNDDDGIDDDDEVAAGTGVNLVTPTIGQITEQSFPSGLTDIDVTGTNFVAGITVLFDGSPVTPENLTPTSFDFTVPVATSGTKALVVTRPNGESAADSVFVQRIVPTIDTITQQSFPSGLTDVDVTGTHFDAGMTVLFDGSPVTPENLTSTSFDFTVPVATSGPKDLVVTLPNGESASDSVFVQRIVPTITDVVPEVFETGVPTPASVTGTNFDASMTVDYDGTVLVPANLTATSFDVTITADEGDRPLTVTLPNGESDSHILTGGGDLRRIFLYPFSTGNLGGLAGADALCAAEASNLGLTGTYLAWLSDASTDPASRFTQTGGPFVNVDVERVASDWADLTDGSLENPIAPQGTTVWSNTLADGTAASGEQDCLGWTTGSSSEIGSRALPASTSSSWSDPQPDRDIACNGLIPFYCVEQ